MSEMIRQPGLLLVVSSPSGAGKTTLCHRLLAEFNDTVTFSVSYTTRTMRKGEEDGVDYHFVDDPTFDKMVARGDFAEWAEVHGRRYGTTAAAVQQALDDGRDVLFDIDYQGGRQIKARFGHLAVLVFVLPPSFEELERRLRQRNTDAPQMIEQRLEKAREELEHYGLYDYLLVNDHLSEAYDGLRSIYFAAAHRIQRKYERAELLIRAARATAKKA